MLSDEESTYLSPEAIKAISFEPISSDYYSDGEYTPWGEWECVNVSKVKFLIIDKLLDVIYS